MDTPPPDPKVLALEAELEDCLRNREFLDALDVCEEIETSGRIELRHLLVMAECLLELRRKADAKQTWMRILEIDADNADALQGLNRNFPGWRLAPPKPTPSADSPSMSVRVGSTGATPSAAAAAPAGGPGGGGSGADAKPAVSKSAESARSAPKGAGASGGPAAGNRGGDKAGTLAGAGRVGAERGAVTEVGEINWDYVLEDFEESRVTASG